MIEVLLILLIIFWALGYVHVGNIVIPNAVLLQLNGRPITLWDVIIFVLVLWAVGILPTPFREIAGVLLALWVLSLLGLIAIAGLSNLIVIAIIVGIVASFVKR
ncbi:hypothetical protein BH10PAT2_BH10PAT2_2410 [soil metagenome]